MDKIKVKCPAKINLDLKVINKRPDGFHNIESTMAVINLYDYLTISVQESDKTEIVLSGSSKEIPYDKTNLIYKAAELFLSDSKIQNKKIEIYAQKNIPISAGLAGGSTDAAGTLYGLNKLFKQFSTQELHKMCAQLGSDLNVCLAGGILKTSGRGEIVVPAEFEELNISLIKPNSLGISAKEAYTKFGLKQKTPDRQNYVNDLEWAVIDDYKELQYIKNKYPKAIMTGSGSAFYMINGNFENEKGFTVINGLKTINHGVI